MEAENLNELKEENRINMSIVRKISQNELMYMDMQDITSSFAIQYLIEYSKPVDINILRTAVNNVQQKYKDCFVKAQKNYWAVNSNPVNIIELTLDTDDIYNSDIFFEKLDYNKETFIIYVIKNRDKNYICFKFSHSVMDGKGAILLLDVIFAEINNQTLPKCENSTNDEEFINGLKCSIKKIDLFKKYNLISSVKDKSIDKNKVGYKVFKFQKYHQGVIAKLAVIFASVFKEKNIKFMIPTDIRRHKSETFEIANLVLPIFINASKDENWQDVNYKLLNELKNNKELNLLSVKYNYRLFPSQIRKQALKALFCIKEKENSYPIGAILSHLGRINLEKYNIKDNEAESFCSLPVQQPLVPFSVVISEYNNKTEMALSYYKDKVSEEIIEKLSFAINSEFDNSLKYDFNNRIYEYETNIIEELSKAEKANSRNIAIFENNKTYTYKELFYKAGIIAKNLQNQGLKQQDKVILNMERSFDFIACVIAVLKLGAVFIPVDKSEKEYRVNQIIENSNAKFVINNVDDFSQENGTLSGFYNYKKDDEIYNIFTSGTTGVPKGVSISCGNFSNYILWAKRTYTSVNRLIMPLFTSLSVDLTLTSLFLPLITNGAVKIFSEKFNNLTLKQIYNDMDINVVKCTPSHLSLLQIENTNLKEWLIIGGENFSKVLYNKIKNIHKNIVNEYGPTETTVGCIYHICSNEYPQSNIPVGLPIDNTNVYLVNEKGNLIDKEDEIGEIVISGNSVSNGYINAQSLNHKKYNNENCYFTGDLGFINNSVIHCIGRKDSQVKINGKRIELEEINANLLGINGVLDAQTLVISNRIISFVITQDEQLSENEIIEQLKNKLSDNAIPKQIIFIKEFLLLPNGKLDTDYLKTKVKIFEAETEVINPIKILIKKKFSDESFNFEYDKLYDIGLDSLDTLILAEELAAKLPIKNQEAFLKEYISFYSTIDVFLIEKLLQKYGYKK